MASPLGAGSADQYLGRFTGTFDLEDHLSRDSLVVAVVIGTVDSVTSKQDKRSGNSKLISVITVEQFATIEDYETQSILYERLALERAELPQPIAITPGPQVISAEVAEPIEHDDPAPPIETVVVPEEPEIFSPGAAQRVAAVGGARVNDPVLARFLTNGSE